MCQPIQSKFSSHSTTAHIVCGMPAYCPRLYSILLSFIHVLDTSTEFFPTAPSCVLASTTSVGGNSAQRGTVCTRAECTGEHCSLGRDVQGDIHILPSNNGIIKSRTGVCWGYAGGMLGVYWEHPGGILGVCWGYAGGILGVCWGYTGSILGVYWEYPGGILGVSWGYSGGMLGVCWGYAGGMLGVSWGVFWGGYTGSILGVCWEYPGGILGGVYWEYPGGMLGVWWGYTRSILGVCCSVVLV